MAKQALYAITDTIRKADDLGLRLDGYYVVEILRDVSTNELYEMIRWLEEPDRPGFFDYDYNPIRGRGHPATQVDFYFTNEATAFEFKVRWK